MQSTVERRRKPFRSLQGPVFACMLLTSTALATPLEDGSKMQNSSECKEYARTEIERAMLPRGKARFEIEYNNAIAKRKLIEKYGEDAPKKCLEQPRVAATLQNAQKRKEREAKENIPSKPQSGDRNFWKGIGEFVWLCAVFIIITGFLSKIFDAD